MSDLYITNRTVPYRTDLCRGLSAVGYKVFRYEEGDIPVRNVAGKAVLRNPVDLLSREHPSHILVPEFSGMAVQMVMLRKRFGFKVISFCDDSLDMIQGNDFSLMHRVARRLVPGLLDGIITLSPAVARWYEERFGLKPLWMPIMADECRIRPELERVLPLSESLRPSRRPVVAFVGRFVGLKNIPALIEAFQPWKDRAQLVLIGDGPLRSQLEIQAPDAIFPGMVYGDDLLAWYNLIDILVLPSTQEAYGAVTGEALMAGAKVIVSRKAGSTDLVREGQNGFLVDPTDVAGLTGRIGQLLDTLPEGRPLTLRDNLHPYRFQDRLAELVDGINN